MDIFFIHEINAQTDWTNSKHVNTFFTDSNSFNIASFDFKKSIKTCCYVYFP